jgi:GNAT superfamily N-acetyltransferase
MGYATQHVVGRARDCQGAEGGLMIRTATSEDVEALVELLSAGHRESPRWGAVPLVVDHLRVGIATAIPTGGVFVAVRDEVLVGVLIGTTHRYWFSDCGYAANMQFYISKAARGSIDGVRLISAFEAWAIARGVIELRLSVDAAINDAAAVRLFEAMGYAPSCASYSKYGSPRDAARGILSASSRDGGV